MKIKKEAVAKFIRAVTVPPVLVCVLILVLSVARDDIFYELRDIIMSFVLLGVVPVLAYPLQRLLPGFQDKGREGQRKLAFILNIAGYTLAFILSFAFHVNDRLMLIYTTYFCSVIILAVFNLLHIRASGHACSAAGPFLFFIYFTGWTAVIPCLVVMALIIWSSLILKRHTIKELTLGLLTFIAAFLLSSCLI